MSIKYRVLDNNGVIFFCNIEDNYKVIIGKVVNKSQVIKNVRAGFYNYDGGSVYAFTSKSDYVNSSKKFVAAFDVIINSIYDIKQMIDDAKEVHNRQTANSTPKCNTRLCNLTEFLKDLLWLPKTETFSRP